MSIRSAFLIHLLVACSSNLAVAEPPLPYEIERLSMWGGETEAVHVESGLAYVGSGVRLLVVDVTDPSRPAELGAVDVGSHVYDVVYRDGFAYLAAGSEGLIIVDVSQPKRPRVVGRNRDGTGWHLEKITLTSNAAYLCGGGDIYMYDVARPDVPVFMGPYDLGPFATENLYAFGNTLLASDRYDGGTLWVIRLTHPFRPQETGTIVIGRDPLEIAVEGDRAYVAYSDYGREGGVAVVDISDRRNPELLGAHPIEGARDLVVRSGIAYVVAAKHPFTVVDLTNPQQPVLLAKMEPKSPMMRIDSEGSLAFIAEWVGGVLALDIGDPARPERVGRFESFAFLHDSYLLDDVLYIAGAGGSGAVHFLDVSNTSEPQYLGRHNTDGRGVRTVVVRKDGIGFVAAGEAGGQIVDFTDLENPRLLATFPGVETAEDVVVEADIVYITDGDLHIFDVSDPVNPVLLGRHVDRGRYLSQIIVSNGYAFANGGSLVILDVSDPRRPFEVYTGLPSPISMDLHEQTLFVGTERYNYPHVLFLDVSDPANPRQVGRFEMRTEEEDLGDPYGITVDDGMMHLSGDQYYLVDVSSLRTPRVIAKHKGSPHANVTLDGSLAYATNSWEGNGVGIFRFGPRRPHGVIYVDANATGDNEGTNWASAFTNLDSALGLAIPGDEIRVAEGVYIPSAPAGGSEATFSLVTGVQLYGGYAGHGAPDPDERDVKRHVTILSGDRLGDDGPDFQNYGDNTYHVVTADDLEDSTIIDGFTIRAGGAYDPRDLRDGGGMLIRRGAPVVGKCTFEANTGARGGGVYAVSVSPTFDGCTFRRNWGLYSGGLDATRATAVAVTGCVFEKNYAERGSGGFSHEGDVVVVRDTLFIANSAGTGVGGMSSRSKSIVLEDTAFERNEGRNGAGLFLFRSEAAQLTNCRFQHNVATEDGGGMVATEVQQVELRDCIFLENRSAGDGGGVLFEHSSAALKR